LAGVGRGRAHGPRNTAASGGLTSGARWR
jgi:hypothetical protein